MYYFSGTIGLTTGFASGGTKGAVKGAAVGVAYEYLQRNFIKQQEMRITQYLSSKLGQGILGVIADDIATVLSKTRVTAVAAAPTAAAVTAGIALGVGTTIAGTAVAEKVGLVSKGATKNFIEMHKSLAGLNKIYNPLNILKNLETVYAHYGPDLRYNILD